MDYHIIQVRFKSARCNLIVFEGRDVITLGDLYATKKREGHGTKVMEMACAIADGLRRDVALKPHAHGQAPRMTSETLIAFYKRFGFVVSAEHQGMLRRANAG